jgi:hypothetical protein
MDTYFCRHTEGISIDDATRRRLWEGQRIAVHYPFDRSNNKLANDNPSLDPNDYGERGAVTAISTMRRIARDGGYVCAEYSGHPNALLGRVEPGTEIELFRGQWKPSPDDAPREAVLKSLRLTKVHELPPLGSIVLLVGRPRQGALVQWHAIGSLIADLVEERSLTPSFDRLNPTLQEVMCAEFLRISDTDQFGLPRLVHLLLPVGRTMRDADIYGVCADGRQVVAQVTHDNFAAARWKINGLKKFAPVEQDAHLILFCDCDSAFTDNSVKVFPIRQAYDVFTSSQSGKEWLKLALPSFGTGTVFPFESGSRP